MASIIPLILSSSTFSCSRSNSRKSSHTRIKSKLSSSIARRSSHTPYRGYNNSREQLLVPSDHSLVEPIHNYQQEPRPSSLDQHWYCLKSSKSTKSQASNSNKEFGGYYLLAATSRSAPSTETSPRYKRNSAPMASDPGSANANTNNIFGESFESTATDIRDERRRSYGIGGAGNILSSVAPHFLHLHFLMRREEAFCRGLEWVAAKKMGSSEGKGEGTLCVGIEGKHQIDDDDDDDDDEEVIVDPRINYMSELHTTLSWDLTPAIDLFHRLSTPITPSVNDKFSIFDSQHFSPENDSTTADKCAVALGDFTPIWKFLGIDTSTICQDSDFDSYGSIPSFASGGVFSGLDSLPSSATDDSDSPDIFETYVTKTKEVRWNDQVPGSKCPKLKRRSTRDLEKNSKEQASPRRQKLSGISQTDESSGLESELETPSRLKSAGFLTEVPIVISPLYNLAYEEKIMKIARKLSDQYGIDKTTLLNTKTNLQNSTDPDAIHVFVDYSNIMIGFQHALKTVRRIPQWMHTKIDSPFSYRSLAFIMERNRPAARRILAGSKLNHSPVASVFAEAQICGYENNILDRVWKNRELTPRKARRGRGTGYLNGQSSGSETPYSNTATQGYLEQGVDELLHMKLLETIIDYKPSTIVLATGDGAEAEYSAGFFKNVERALMKGWKVELVAWKQGLSHEYQSKAFVQRWKNQFSVICLEDFSEELLATYT
ncbi:hypothetical protein SBOR_5509 [Sclerotinia borealis F-4128]|uniref:NYN domain-containing protein n=1 Tax=Sclerotinia borealis (strain F-4128) TaxID=1432307 RepID=W9CH66_SCLBF|nr:hypothetical protein SBOR_5509 [Sclerotinia borealis F-4128]